MTSRKSKIIWLTAALTFMAALIFFISQRRAIDSDELESLYASWLISKGQLVYRDFYQMHSPLAYYLFAPIFFFLKSLKVISAARAVVSVLVLFNGFLLFKISRRLFDSKIAIASVFFYLTSWPVFYKMIEIRPDVFVAIFSNLSLVALFGPAQSAIWLFFLAGICSALAVLSKQSGMIFFVSLTAFFLLLLAEKKSCFWNSSNFSKERFSAKTFLFFIAGFLMTAAAFILILRQNKAEVYFFAHSVNNDFLRKLLFLKTEANDWRPDEFIKGSFNFNPGIYLFSLVSVFLVFVKPNRRRAEPEYIFILFLALICFGSLFLILHPWPQEFILPAQYLSIASGAALIRLSESACSADLKIGKKLIYLIFISATITFSALMFFRGIAQELKIANQYPGESIKKILSSTKENDKCLSIDYPCLFRPSVYFYRLGTALLESGSSRKMLENILIADINRGEIKVILPSSKLDQMPNLKGLIEGNYVMRSNDFFIPGGRIDLADNQTKDIDILVEGRYWIECVGAKVMVDGADQAEKPVYLKRGRHQVSGYGGSAKVAFSYDFNANKKIR